jgi:hypothetical protein
MAAIAAPGELRVTRRWGSLCRAFRLVARYLRTNSSGGNTNVFINGRELHYLDVLGLQRLGPVLPGRYWVDTYWNCGYEGGPALFNLAQLMRSRSGSSQGGAWSYTTKQFTNNTTVGGDGAGFMYVSGKDHHGDSYSYFP